jgi:phage tail-like protein
MLASEIKALLPAVFEDAAVPESPLAALLETMESLHRPCEDILARLEGYFDPRQAPARFVPFLAGWVDLDFPVSTGLGRLRELVARSVALSRMRGTASGLIDFLTTATDVEGFTIEEGPSGADGEPLLFHVRVRAPASTRPHRRMLLDIIEREKPAYVTSELVFEDDP